MYTIETIKISLQKLTITAAKKEIFSCLSVGVGLSATRIKHFIYKRITRYGNTKHHKGQQGTARVYNKQLKGTTRDIYKYSRSD